MIDHNRLVREAAVQDGADTLDRSAAEIERVAARFDDVSQNTLRRVAAQMRTIAMLKRPKVGPTPVAAPETVWRPPC